jgi:hypothetical protein
LLRGLSRNVYRFLSSGSGDEPCVPRMKLGSSFEQL